MHVRWWLLRLLKSGDRRTDTKHCFLKSYKVLNMYFFVLLCTIQTSCSQRWPECLIFSFVSGQMSIQNKKSCCFNYLLKWKYLEYVFEVERTILFKSVRLLWMIHLRGKTCKDFAQFSQVYGLMGKNLPSKFSNLKSKAGNTLEDFSLFLKLIL